MSAGSTVSSVTSAISNSSVRAAPDVRTPGSPASPSEEPRSTSAQAVALSEAAEADLAAALLLRVHSAIPDVADHTQISSLANLVKTFRASVTVKDRTYRLRRYKSCFTGVDAVRTLIAIGAAQTIEEALIVGNNLIADQIIEHGLLSWPS
eukprot:contig_3211_g685